MPKMIQIRHVPDDLHATLKERAARERTSLSDYILRELEEIARAPTLEEWFEEVKRHAPVEPSISSAELIRLERDSR